MGSSLNLSLTDELRAFVDESCGDGTGYSTPSEFVRALLREKKQRIEAARIRDAILEGYQDAIAGRIVRYDGNLRRTIKKARNEHGRAAAARRTGTNPCRRGTLAAAKTS